MRLQSRVLLTREPIRHKGDGWSRENFLNAYRRVVLGRNTSAVVPYRRSPETLGKMPELRHMPRAPFAQTRQTLPVLLDRPNRLDDFDVETTRHGEL